ncbi:MAG: MerR family transcriptional regulator [Actinomycetota bacterium]
MSLRIGEVAEQVGVTPRTIRYYEERGLLDREDRPKGAHRTYDEADVVRLRELIRLRDLLGLSLEELVELAEVETERAGLRERWEEDLSDEERQAILARSTELVTRQLELVRKRQSALDDFATDLEERLVSLRSRRRELARQPSSKL